MKKRFGVIGSSGGSALIAAMQCLAKAGYELEPIIISDRKCGMTDWANDKGFPVSHIPYHTKNGFSEAAFRYFQTMGCRDVMLFYTRIVGAPLIDSLKVWNIHPGLLPAFVGLHAVRQALVAKVSLFGATLHRVDAGLDTGPIAAQVAESLLPEISEHRAQRLSYIQKVWLTLVWFELISDQKNSLFSAQYIGPGLALSSCDLSDARLKKIFLVWLETLESVTRKDKE
jgi:phosphoribosylglycinamide formyltransferase-1